MWALGMVATDSVGNVNKLEQVPPVTFGNGNEELQRGKREHVVERVVVEPDGGCLFIGRVVELGVVVEGVPDEGGEKGLEALFKVVGDVLSKGVAEERIGRKCRGEGRRKGRARGKVVECENWCVVWRRHVVDDDGEVI